MSSELIIGHCLEKCSQVQVIGCFGLAEISGAHEHEPLRDCRRLVGLSYAAMGTLSMALVAA